MASGQTWRNPFEAGAVGMGVALTARDAPERTAIFSPHGNRSYAELNAQANQLVRALRSRGLGNGDAVALLCSNRPEFAEVFAGVLRAGFRLTCISWHLQADEVSYIVDNCEAKAFIADARFADVALGAAAAAPAGVKLGLGGSIDSFEDYRTALDGEATEDIDDPSLGTTMLYTSGTTGRPKGVYRREAAAIGGLGLEVIKACAFSPETDRVICTGPLYHTAPLAFNLAMPLGIGIGSVLMDSWEPAEMLRLIEEHRVTHTHMVAAMFHRLLALPEEIRTRHDLSSFRSIIHGAAPTPVHVKKAMIDWLGPILWEYYAATEGGGTFIGSEEWLTKPGSVGKPVGGEKVDVRDDHGREVPSGEIGTIYFRAPEVGRFEYFKDREKTESSYSGDYFTLGDVGYTDEDGYVFLTGRTSELIISGGVNIYPAEVDEALMLHPAVADVATVGVPNEEWGEEVKAVVQPAEGQDPNEALASDLLDHCRAHLAHFKCPRSIDFDAALPRTDAGKIYRRRVRDRYWSKDGRQI